MMTKNEARLIAEKELEPYRQLGYQEIKRRLDETAYFDRKTEDGNEYTVQFQFFYDDSRSGNIRVGAAITYSTWTYFSPVNSDFIIAPSGDFVGE